MLQYKKILLKFSGESLQAVDGFSIDSEKLMKYAHQVKEIVESTKNSVKSSMRILKGLKLSKEKGVWKMKNATKEKRSLAEKTGITLTPNITSPA